MTDEHKAIVDAMNAAKLDTLIGDVGELKSSMKELTRAVTRLAVIEERVGNNGDSLGRAFKEIEKHDARIKLLEGDAGTNKQSSDLVNKVVLIIITAVVTALLGLVVVSRGGEGQKTPVIIQGPKQ